MKRLLLPLIAALAFPTAVNAGVNHEIHKLCKDAKDYVGCVKVQSDFSNHQRMTIDKGVSLAEGNSCPSKWLMSVEVHVVLLNV